MRYSVTGISDDLTLEQYSFVANVICELNYVDELTTGAADNVDTAAFYVGLSRFPMALHRVCYPHGFYHNEQLVRNAIEQGCEVIPIYGGYMKRNDALVSHADELIAFPETATEIQRSGTWATIRRARKAGIPVRTHPLNEIT